MAIRHSNPTKPRVDRERNEIWARAPYNFIPLPEVIVPANKPLPLDIYSPEGVSGWIDCELETCSPTYIRGMLTASEIRRIRRHQYRSTFSGAKAGPCQVLFVRWFNSRR